MKTFNVKHEVKILSNLKPVLNRDTKEGDLVEHIETVIDLEFYTLTAMDTYSKVFISKDFITDLYDQIKSIEAKKQIIPYCSLPF